MCFRFFGPCINPFLEDATQPLRGEIEDFMCGRSVPRGHMVLSDLIWVAGPHERAWSSISFPLMEQGLRDFKALFQNKFSTLTYY